MNEIEPTESDSPLRVMYIVWMLLFVFAMSCLQFLVGAGLFWVLYGSINFADLTTQKMPEYSHAALWQGRVYYPVRTTVGGATLKTGTLMSFDPEKGDTKELPWEIPTPCTGLVARGDQLWIVSSNSVCLIDGDQMKEIPAIARFTLASEPFLYHGQIAVIDSGGRSAPRLFVFQNDNWVNLGTIAIPVAFHYSVVDGKNVLVSNAKSTTGRVPLLDLQVLSNGDKLHLFVSDGSVIAYRSGLELALASALAPENVDLTADPSNLEDWEVACLAPANVGIGGKRNWKASLVNDEPTVLATTSSSKNLFQSFSLLGYRRVEGEWKKTIESSIPAPIELFAVSDGQKSYFGGHSLFGGMLRIHRVDNTEIVPTGAVIKQPVAGFQKSIENGTWLFQWIYWPGLLIFVLGVDRLMKAWRVAEYQFGLTVVQMASFVRRAIARVIDYWVYVSAIFLVTWLFGLSGKENIEKNLDRMYDFSPDGLMIRWIWLMLSLLLSVLLILIINSWLQGRWGVTLGKWLCGIRTVRSTLRPCGFARAMLRELLLLADTLFVLSYIPATLLIAFTNCRQRIGDMVADTIVIRKPVQQPADTDQRA